MILQNTHGENYKKSFHNHVMWFYKTKAISILITVMSFYLSEGYSTI